MKKIAFLWMMIFCGGMAFAHEGHDDTPGQLKAVHGGVVKAGKQINLEYVVSGSEIRLYPLAHGGQELKMADLEISGTAQAPKGKPQKLSFKQADGAFVGELSFGAAYRLSLNITAKYKSKADVFKIQAEQ